MVRKKYHNKLIETHFNFYLEYTTAKIWCAYHNSKTQVWKMWYLIPNFVCSVFYLASVNQSINPAIALISLFYLRYFVTFATYWISVGPFLLVAESTVDLVVTPKYNGFPYRWVMLSGPPVFFFCGPHWYIYSYPQVSPLQRVVLFIFWFIY